MEIIGILDLSYDATAKLSGFATLTGSEFDS